MLMKTSLLYCLVFISFSISSKAQIKKICLQQIIEEGKLFRKNNRTVSTGTGFLVGDLGYFITNKHVISGDNSNITIVFKVEGKDVKVKAKLIMTSIENDIALLKIDDNIIKNILSKGNPIKLRDKEITMGEATTVLGYPLPGIMGQSLKLTTGIVNSTSGFSDDINEFQMSAQIQPGNSGSPIFDAKGSLVGIAVSSLRSGQNVNYGIKAKFIKELIPNIKFTKSNEQIGINTLKNYVGLIYVESDKTYYKELTFSEGKLYTFKPASFFDNDGNNCNEKEINLIHEYYSNTDNPESSTLLEEIRNDIFSNAIISTYIHNNGRSGSSLLTKTYALLEVGAYQNIVEDIEDLLSDNPSKQAEDLFYVTHFRGYCWAKVNLLRIEPTKKQGLNLVNEISKAILVYKKDFELESDLEEKKDISKKIAELYLLKSLCFYYLNENAKAKENYKTAKIFDKAVKDKELEVL